MLQDAGVYYNLHYKQLHSCVQDCRETYMGTNDFRRHQH